VSAGEVIESPLEARAWLGDVMTSVLAGVETR
jgi:hypothetical protein